MLVAGPPEHGFYLKDFINYKDDMIKHGETISYGCNATYTFCLGTVHENAMIANGPILDHHVKV